MDFIIKLIIIVFIAFYNCTYSYSSATPIFLEKETIVQGFISDDNENLSVIDDGMLVGADMKDVNIEYEYYDKTYYVNFKWCKIGEYNYVYEPEEFTNNWNVEIPEGNKNIVEVELIDDFRQVYSFFYDLSEGVIIDILQDVPEEYKPYINDIRISEDLSFAILYCSKNEKVFYFNTIEGSFVELAVLSGVESANMGLIIDNTTLLIGKEDWSNVEKPKGEYYLYDLSSGATKPILKELPIYREASQQEGIVFYGIPYAVIHRKDGIDIVDLKTGEKSPIGFSKEDIVSIQNANNDYFLVTSKKDDTLRVSLISAQDACVVAETDISDINGDYAGVKMINSYEEFSHIAVRIRQENYTYNYVIFPLNKIEL